MKPHFPVLDGLRGTASLLVVIFHLYEGFYPKLADNPMGHGYLAVDFFYLLSGFVVAYAYDDRWTNMGFWGFMKIRLVRLHPLVILGVAIGLIGFLVNPFSDTASTTSMSMIVAATLMGFTLLPYPDIRGWGETHSLNGPCWSLLQEYIGNILYALVGFKMGVKSLSVVVTIAAIALTGASIWHGDVGTGWSLETMWIGTIRMVFPFFAGLLLYRLGKRIQVPQTFVICSIALAIIFCMPVFKYNGLYDALVIIFIFPVLIAAGAGATISGRMEKLCKFAGDISYPIYILHYPFIYIYITWIYDTKAQTSQIVTAAVFLFFFFIALAYIALKLYDEPIRKFLKLKYLKPTSGQ
jgi:peptidoglycan/LPS O-acetylase OafA/YrhL